MKAGASWTAESGRGAGGSGDQGQRRQVLGGASRRDEVDHGQLTRPMNEFRDAARTPSAPPFVVGDERSRKILRRRPGAERRLAVDSARRGARAGRRERRGQVDPHPDPCRPDAARRRRHCSSTARPSSIETPHRANELGMSFIHQELAFVPGMTVLENIMLGMPKRRASAWSTGAAIAARGRADRRPGRRHGAARRERARACRRRRTG